VTDPAVDPDWARLLAAARRSLERTGGSLAGTISITAPTDAERRIIIGMTGVHRSAGAARLAVRLVELDAHLRQAHGRSLVAVLAPGGTPLRDRPGERKREAVARDAVVSEALAGLHAREAWYERWLEAMRRDGTLTRIVRAGLDFGSVVRVLDALPAAEEPMPAFAERVLADTKALADGPVRGLVQRAIAIWQDGEVPTSAEQERALWESVGVVPDDLASQVLVLNIPAAGGLVGSLLAQAAQAGVPMRLTLHQLRLTQLAIDCAEMFVTENPAVLRAATAMGATAPPIVCTEGIPSVAAHRLLSFAQTATLWWRNDFDWPGIRMTGAALTRYPNARPWRMTVADYRSAPGAGPDLVGTPVATPWEPGLADEMRTAGRAVMEERLLPTLIGDLRDHHW
jgi:uncharacterized protein (TIGR02679 family)